MFSLSSKNKAGEISLIIDIQSDLVRGALISFSHGEKPHVIYTSSQHISSESKIDGARTTDLMIRAISDIGNKIAKDGIKDIKSVHYILSSPWVIPQSKTVKIEYDTETEVKDSIILDIINKERKELIAKFKEGNLSKEYEFDIIFIEENIFDVKLNGYSVTDYRGKKTKTLEISFATTLSSEKILKKINKIIKSVIKVKKIHYHSALLLRYTALRLLIDNKSEYISMHIHGELTDIVIVKRDFSSYLASFPFGRTTVVRRLSGLMKSTIKAGDSSLTMFEEGKLEKNEEQRVSKFLLPILDEWKLQLLDSIHGMNNGEFIPRSVYLSTHRHYNLFKDIISKENFEVFPFDDSYIDKNVIFDESLEKNSLIGIYAFAINDML